VKRCPIILIDRSVNAGIVGFRGSTQPTGGNPTQPNLQGVIPLGESVYQNYKSS
jgi:hypothetical protein